MELRKKNPLLYQNPPVPFNWIFFIFFLAKIFSFFLDKKDDISLLISIKRKKSESKNVVVVVRVETKTAKNDDKK